MPDLDRFVSADPPVPGEVPVSKTPPAEKEQRRARAKLAHEDRVRRWRDIEAAGGIDNWIQAELRKKGLVVDDGAPALPDNPHLAKSVDELELSVRSANAFADAGFTTIGDIVRNSEADLLKLKSFNRQSLQEVKDVLKELGLSLGMGTSTAKAAPVGDKAAYKERKKAEAAEKRALRKLAWEAFKATHINHLGTGVHWSEHIDVDRFDIAERETRAEALRLPALPTPQALADALGVTIPHLRWLATHKDVDTGTHYRRFTIPKRDGSARTIAEPMPVLKGAQRWLLENIVEKLEVHGAAHGFLADRSILTNARAHAGADVIVKIDIKDFFPSLTFERTKGLLRKAGLVEQIATLLALLATEAPRDVVKFRGQTLYVATGPRALPQGAPSSPMITNTVCLRLDKRLSGLARKLGCSYTRYADDLTFSFRSPARAQPKDKRKEPIGMLIGATKRILAEEGFVLHEKKTAVLRKGDRQKVTGLVVNHAPGRPAARVPRDVRRRLRASIHNRRNGKARDGETLEQLKGMAAFVHMTDPAMGRRFLDKIEALEKPSA